MTRRMVRSSNLLVCGFLFALIAFLTCLNREVKSQGDDDILDSLEDIQSADVCRETARFEHSYPQNRTSAGVIRLLHERNDEQSSENFTRLCIATCCSANYSNGCDYVWVFGDKCYSLECRTAESCRPLRTREMKSMMVQMKEEVGQVAVSGDQQPDTGATEAAGSTSPPTTSSDVDTLTVNTPKDLYIVQLPESTLKIFGSVYPLPKEGVEYNWRWEVSGGEGGTVEGSTEPTLVLSHLVQGFYKIKVTVTTSDGKMATSYVNVSVVPAPAENEPPQVVLQGNPSVTIRLPDNTWAFDASKSTDDGVNPLRFKWELISKPVGAPSMDPVYEPEISVTDLQEGNYVFMITVTDEGGLTANKQTTITVEPAKDDPPTADTGGSTYTVQLPDTNVTVNANASKDDHGIVKYEWEQLEGDPVNIKGVKSKYLYLSGLQKGKYQFKLTVEDAKGQTDSKIVSIVVKAESINPPIAEAGENQKVFFPENSVKLDGSHSSDAYKIKSYSWDILSGPKDVTIQDPTEKVTMVTNLHIEGESPTVYTFQLNVTNHRNLFATSQVNITVYKNDSIPPTADAGSDVFINLPQNSVILDGKGSHDDFGIASYQWTKSLDSPAAGLVVDHSDRSAVLMLTNLVVGVYNYTLCVENKNGVSNCDSVTVTVYPEPNADSIVQMVIDAEVTSFPTSSLESLMLAIKLELERNQLDNVQVDVLFVHQYGSDTIVEFTVKMTDVMKEFNGSLVLEKLSQYQGGGTLRGVTIKSIDTKVCLNACSGHGRCEQRSKKCICDVFWMENFFTSNFGLKRSNCEWSVLYFALIICAIILVFITTCLLLCCCYVKRKQVKRRRRIKYALLKSHDEDDPVHLLPRGKNSVMVSESDSEEEVLFDQKSSVSMESPPPRYTSGNSKSKHRKSSSLINGIIPR